MGFLEVSFYWPLFVSVNGLYRLVSLYVWFWLRIGHLNIMWQFCPALSCFSCVWLFVTLWAVACQSPLSMGFSRERYLSGLPCPSPGGLPDPGIEPVSLMSPALAGRFFTTSATWEAQKSDSPLPRICCCCCYLFI